MRSLIPVEFSVLCRSDRAIFHVSESSAFFCILPALCFDSLSVGMVLDLSKNNFE